MALVKITFDGSSVSSKQDADINYHLTGLKADGVIRGLGGELAVSASNNYITFKSGYVQIYGRRLYVEEGSQVYISLDSIKNGYVIIQINLSNNTTTLTKVESTSFPTLTQQNLHNNGTIYQMAIAKYSKTTTSLTLDSTFKPNYIETPLSVASSGYQDAVKYVDNRYGFYAKKNYGTSNKCTIYLYEDEYNTYNSTIFFVKLSVGILVAIPGNGSSGMSNVTVDYVYGGANHTLVLGVSSSEKALIFTCNTTSHYVKKVYAYR